MTTNVRKNMSTSFSDPLLNETHLRHVLCAGHLHCVSSAEPTSVFAGLAGMLQTLLRLIGSVRRRSRDDMEFAVGPLHSYARRRICS